MTKRPVDSPLGRQLVAFTAVGLAGLAVDAGAFLLLTKSWLWPIALARPAALGSSIVVTWFMNRAITFAKQRSARRTPELLRYAAVQAGGLVVNLGVFGLCLALAPSLERIPLVPLFLGCAAGFTFNFTVLRLVVFRAKAAPQTERA
jgi:putative flippase GtrA